MASGRERQHLKDSQSCLLPSSMGVRRQNGPLCQDEIFSGGPGAHTGTGRRGPKTLSSGLKTSMGFDPLRVFYSASLQRGTQGVCQGNACRVCLPQDDAGHSSMRWKVQGSCQPEIVETKNDLFCQDVVQGAPVRTAWRSHSLGGDTWQNVGKDSCHTRCAPCSSSSSDDSKAGALALHHSCMK